MFVSLHRGPDFFPGGLNRAADCGFGEGEGFSVNVCWDFPHVNDAEYQAAFEHIIMPIARHLTHGCSVLLLFCATI